MGSLQGIPNPLRMREELAQVLPHQGIELVRRAITRWAARGGWRLKSLHCTPAPGGAGGGGGPQSSFVSPPARKISRAARARRAGAAHFPPPTPHKSPNQI